MQRNKTHIFSNEARCKLPVPGTSHELEQVADLLHVHTSPFVHGILAVLLIKLLQLFFHFQGVYQADHLLMSLSNIKPISTCLTHSFHRGHQLLVQCRLFFFFKNASIHRSNSTCREVWCASNVRLWCLPFATVTLL